MSNQYRKLPYQGGSPREISEVVNNAMEGKINSTGTFTLATGGATTTTITDRRIGADSVILFMPTTLGAGSVRNPYGSFKHDGTQTFAVADTAYVLGVATTIDAYGMSLASNQITIDYAAEYRLSMKGNFTNPESQHADAYVWLRKNGTDIPDTCVHVVVTDKQGSHGGAGKLSYNRIFEFDDGDYIEVVAAVSDVDVKLEYVSATTTPYVRPAIPSLIVDINTIASTQGGGGSLGMFVSSRTTGSAVVTHLPNSISGKTFDYLVIGQWFIYIFLLCIIGKT